MLATLLRPDGGRARVLGHDIVADANAVRGLVALTGQYASVDEDLTGRENLVLLARARVLARVSNDHAPCQGVPPGGDGFTGPLAPMT